MNLKRWIRTIADKLTTGENGAPLSKREIIALAVLLIFCSFLLSILLSGYSHFNIPSYHVGDIALADITVPEDLFIKDEKATREREIEARQKALPVYRLNSSVQEETISKLKAAFAQGRELLGLPAEADGRTDGRTHKYTFRKLPVKVRDKLYSTMRNLGVYPPSDDLTAYLVREEFNLRLGSQIIALLRDSFSIPILPDESAFDKDKRNIYILNAATGKMEMVSLDQVIKLTKARRRIEQRLNQDAAGIPITGRSHVRRILETLLIPNLTFDAHLTTTRQDQDARNVDPVMRQLKKGKIIIRQGDEIGPDHLDQIEAIRKLTIGGSSAKQVIGLGVLIGFLLMMFVISLRSCLPDQWNYITLAVFSVLALVVNILLLNVFWFVCDAVSRNFIASPFNDTTYFFYALPFAYSAMLMTLLAGEQCALLFIIFYSLPAGQSIGVDFYGFLYILLANFIGIIIVRNVTQRIGIIASGFKLGFAAVVLFFILQIAKQEPFDLTSGIFGAALTFLSGPINAILLAFMLPLCERFLKVTTEIRLSELGNVNLPIIRDMILKAPGTYNHSIAVGTLCEGAAKTVGINPLFLRVASLYHDIGKTVLPEYFVENQQQINPHIMIDPRESANILKGHVVEGIRIAREGKLPSSIIDLIPQHHGTRFMRFFYEKAKADAQVDVKAFNVVDFRYPGPKPQTKAASILMIADSIEAASRTLDDHSQDKLLNLIQQIITDITGDEQFSECDITLAEINRITYSFLETFTSYYHNRITYPGFNFDKGKVK
jgi:putative nucleotidyltransferase with HDIG domain